MHKILDNKVITCYNNSVKKILERKNTMKQSTYFFTNGKRFYYPNDAIEYARANNTDCIYIITDNEIEDIIETEEIK